MNKKFALGCMRISNMSVEAVENLVKESLANGVNFFDHADIYGARKCEELFGQVLKKNPELRKQMIIQTKCGICNGYYDLSKEHIISQVEESLRLLNTDYVDILLLHRPDVLMDFNEVNEAFEYLYEHKMVREFGVSNMNVWQMQMFKKYVKQPIKYNQVQFSVIHSLLIDNILFFNMKDNEGAGRTNGLLEYCQLNDIEVQAWSILLASWADGTFIDNPKYEKLNDVLQVLAEKYKVTKNAIALAWISRLPYGIRPVSGTTSVAHLREMLEGLKIELTRQEWYQVYLAGGHYLP